MKNLLFLLIALFLSSCLDAPIGPTPKNLNRDSTVAQKNNNPFKKQKDTVDNTNEFLFKWHKGAKNTIYQTVVQSHSSEVFSIMTNQVVSSKLQESKSIMEKVNTVIEQVAQRHRKPFDEYGYKIEIEDSKEIDLSEMFVHRVDNGRDTIVFKANTDEYFISRGGKKIPKDSTHKNHERDTLPASRN